jgi:hypothetical protein
VTGLEKKSRFNHGYPDKTLQPHPGSGSFIKHESHNLTALPVKYIIQDDVLAGYEKNIPYTIFGRRFLLREKGNDYN